MKNIQSEGLHASNRPEETYPCFYLQQSWQLSSERCTSGSDQVPIHSNINFKALQVMCACVYT